MTTSGSRESLGAAMRAGSGVADNKQVGFSFEQKTQPIASPTSVISSNMMVLKKDSKKGSPTRSPPHQ